MKLGKLTYNYMTNHPYPSKESWTSRSVMIMGNNTHRLVVDLIYEEIRLYKTELKNSKPHHTCIKAIRIEDIEV